MSQLTKKKQFDWPASRSRDLLPAFDVVHDELEVEGLVLVAEAAQVAQRLGAARR